MVRTTVRWSDGAAVPLGGAIGTAFSPCVAPDDRETATVVAVADVPSEVAIAVKKGQSPGVYLANGFLPELRGYPLHKAVFRGRDEARRGRRCGRRARLTGRLEDQPFGAGGALSVLAQGRRTEFEVRSDARVRARLRSGLPYLRKGDRLQIAGRRCLNEYRQRVLFARSIIVLSG